ncbi:MAG: M15 family metallopeptidase [Chloroflexi bacterium]|nr:M15 family metallopeptidase [Chloroflexota bacterium]
MARAVRKATPGTKPLLVVAVLLLPLALVACGDNGDGVDDELVRRSPAPGETPAATSDATPSGPDGASARADATNAASTATPARPTATPNADGVYIVACHDFYVPLDKVHRLDDDCAPDALVSLPDEYAYGPQEVVEGVLPDLLALLEAASEAGHLVAVVSSYRSYETQRNTFEYHVNEYGLDQALRVSARPGHSEHQLGTTVDFSSTTVGYELVEAFGSTPEGRWLADHAHEYGFILSYPEGKEVVTGYAYEPWHFRWVGRELAAEVRASGLTLGQFLLR